MIKTILLISASFAAGFAVATATLEINPKAEPPSAVQATVEAVTVAPPVIVEEKKPELPIDEWEVSEDKSRMDDSAELTVFKLSEDKIDTRVAGGYPGLGIGCKDGRTSVMVLVGSYFGIDERPIVKMRLDSQPQEETPWFTDSENLILQGKPAISLLQRMAEAERIVFRAKTYRGEQLEFEFKLAGLEKHLPRIAEVCRWK